MRKRRHHGRLSSEFLPPQTSLYNAMQAIIGAALRERYAISEQLPSDFDRLLTALKDAERPELTSTAFRTSGTGENRKG
jgi:hypothetical protein